MKIPMVDLAMQYQALKHELDNAVLEVMQDTRFILGPNVNLFEQEVADYLGVSHAISCASGTDALHLSLLALDIQPGDEIITTPFTFAATAEAIRYVNATPVFVDIDERTFNIDPQAVSEAITTKTRAIIPVHLFGQPADMQTLLSICEAKGINLIEDCAQSFGAHIDGRMTGSWGQMGCHSFFPSKNLGAFGDGGMITTHSESLAERLRMLRNHGSRVRYQHEIIGYNSRLDEIQAAILRIKLKHIGSFNNNRRRVANTYNELLKDLPLTTPDETKGTHHVYHQYTILSSQRERILNALQDADIASAIYYPVPLHRQPAFVSASRMPSLPTSEYVCEHCLSLPIYPELEELQIQEITSMIRKVLLD